MYENPSIREMAVKPFKLNVRVKTFNSKYELQILYTKITDCLDHMNSSSKSTHMLKLNFNLEIMGSTMNFS